MVKFGSLFTRRAACAAASAAMACTLIWGCFSADRCAASASGWEQMNVPNTDGGLVVDPHLLPISSMQIFFGWSSNARAVKAPEFSFSVWKDKDWTEIKAPFFGGNVAGVRKVACAVAKQTVGVIFEHNIVEQDARAFEIKYAYSSDRGWSFTKPAVCDSFVCDTKAGTSVNIAGVGGRKPSFCFGWTAESNMVKAALFDAQYRGDSPRAVNLGRYGGDCDRVEMAGEEKGGFVCVWNSGSALMSSYIRPLLGTNEEAVKVAAGRFGRNFTVSDNKGRNATLVYDLPRLSKGDSCRRQVRRWKDGAWQAVPAAPPKAGEAPMGSYLTSCQDEDGNVYVASLSRDGEKIYYSRLKDGAFSDPEVALNLKPMIGCTGISIAVHDGSVYIFASQGPSNQMVRHSL